MIDKEKLKAQLESLTAFIATHAHSVYKANMQDGITTLENSILARPPITEEDRSEVLVLFGQRAQLLDNISIFESSRDELKAELAKVESDNPITQIV